jgi:endonuclease/exonuclease/phosphatase family metal-dependent hydrolase
MYSLFGSLTAFYLPLTVCSLSHCSYKTSTVIFRAKMFPHQLSPSALRQKRLQALGVIEKRVPVVPNNHLVIDVCDSVDSTSDHSHRSINLLESGEFDDRKSPSAKTPTGKRVRKKSPIEAKEVQNNPLSDIAKRRSDESRSYSFTVASYNLWFGPQQDGEPLASKRMDAVYHLLAAQQSCWLIGLQEVVPSLAQALFPKLKSLGYRIFQQPGASYGVSVAVHSDLSILESGWQPYHDTCMARGFVFVRAQVPASSRELLFATTHLESFQRMPNGSDYTGAPQRQAQLRQLAAFCKAQKVQHSELKTILFNGDLNWDDERANCLDPSLVDTLDDSLWKDCFLDIRKGEDKGYTYDGRDNPMLNNSIRRRFDRCLVQGCTVQTVNLVGTEAIPNQSWNKYNPWKRSFKSTPLAPSDHFGLVVNLKLIKLWHNANKERVSDHAVNDQKS